MNLNRFEAIGRVTNLKPHLYKVDAGNPQRNRIFFTLMTNEKWNSNGNKREIGTAVPVQAWGKLADVCHQFLTEGKTVYLDGSLRTTYMEDKKHPGEKVNRFVIKANRIQFGPDSQKVRDLRAAGQAATTPVDEKAALLAANAELEALIQKKIAEMKAVA